MPKPTLQVRVVWAAAGRRTTLSKASERRINAVVSRTLERELKKGEAALSQGRLATFSISRPIRKSKATR